MKKIFLVTMTIYLLMFGSVASAETNYNFVPVSDLGTQAFVDRMGNGSVYQAMTQKGTLVAFTAPARHAELDDNENFPGMSVYRSLFGIKDTQTPNGEIRFYTDSDGKIFIIQFINSGEPQLSGVVLLMAMEAIGLTDQEALPLLQTPSATAETFCANAGRKILRLIADQQGNTVFLFGASN